MQEGGRENSRSCWLFRHEAYSSSQRTAGQHMARRTLTGVGSVQILRGSHCERPERGSSKLLWRRSRTSSVNPVFEESATSGAQRAQCIASRVNCKVLLVFGESRNSESVRASLACFWSRASNASRCVADAAGSSNLTHVPPVVSFHAPDSMRRQAIIDVIQLRGLANSLSFFCADTM